MKVYVASSWRNKHQPHIVAALRSRHVVYDFHRPFFGGEGFHWSSIDPDWQAWTPAAYRKAVTSHPIAALGFTNDFRAMQWCDACVLVMPCGRSAHLELGWCAGAGKHTVIYMPEACEPELMNLLATDIAITEEELFSSLAGWPSGTKP